MTLSTQWISHLKTADDRTHFTDTVYNSSNDVVFMRLKQILVEKLEALKRAERDPKSYELSSWAFAQADNNGSIRTLTQIVDLLSHVKDK